jgi:peptide deformylase
MTVLPIETPDNPVLRKKARPVTNFDADLQTLIDNMIETMRDASGVGLAGPQVNRSLRLTVVETQPEYDDEGEAIEDSRELFVLVNPEIVSKSGKMIEGIEGCLSIPGWIGEVERHEGIRIRALDRNGKKIKMRLDDWTARIVQHEIDHLDGILYIDRLTSPDKFWREEEFYAEQDEVDEEDVPIG